MFKALQNSLLSLIYPQECHVCCRQVENLYDGVACSECWNSTRVFTGSEMLCDKCGAFFGDEAAPIPVFCHECDDHYYDSAVAVGVYEKALAASIINLKSVPHLPDRIKTAIASAIQNDDCSGAEVLIPVPLSKLRRIERGFNQAEIIAAEIARLTGCPLDISSLARTQDTPIHRVGMDKKARELTVRNAFEILRPKLIEGKNILLIDDVFTSGATSSFCAKVLKKCGSGKVNVFTLARAVLH